MESWEKLRPKGRFGTQFLPGTKLSGQDFKILFLLEKKKNIWFQVYVFGNLTARASFLSGEMIYPQHPVENEVWETVNRQGGRREGKGRKEGCEGL